MRIELSTPIEAPLDVVFGLSISVDTHAASMAASGERAIAGVTAGEMRLGDEVTWLARHFGIPWRLTSRITAYERPSYFVDEQIRGPFARWHHAHHFDETPTGTLMRDAIDVAAPLGPIGRIGERLFLIRYMTGLIEARNRYIRSAAESVS
jgi:ligand-binding SRPBCC domain-containing protein